MQQYSAYKPTNIEWLGDVPSHWKVDRLRDVAIINADVLPSNTPFYYKLRYVDISNVNSEGIISFDAIETLEFETAPSRAKRIVKSNDTIVSTVRPNLQAVCFIDFDSSNLICSTGFNVVRPRGEIIDNRFLFYFLICESSKNFFVSRANGVGYPAIGDYDFGSLSITFPSKAEQTVIAKYLDQATTQIDSVIATKQQQLQTLEQYKKSKIHECVTKGLNPNTPLKPSGIEWIGDVPEHWKVWRLKDETEYILTGSTPSSSVQEYYENGTIKWFAPGSYNGEIVLSDYQKLINKKAVEDNELKLFPKGCIFLIGIGATIGKVALIKEESSCNQQLNVIKPTIKLNSNYLIFFMKIYEEIIPKISQYTTLPIFNQTKTGQLPVCIPSLKEQEEIANYLDNFCLKISNEKDIIEQQIATLQQYRKSLIHECVTGKRKVIN